MISRVVALFTCFAFIWIGAQAQNGASAKGGDILVDQKTMASELAADVCDQKKRLEAVEELFRKKGANDTNIRQPEKGKTRNFVVTIPGGKETIVVGAHYDKSKAGCGVVDNWTGIVIIANLFRSISKFETNKTIKFIAFDREEEGLIGSKAFVKSIPKKDRPQICAMLNFDSFGLAYPQVMLNKADKALVELAKESAKGLKLELKGATIRGARSDSIAFSEKGIPALTIHGLSNDFPRILHSKNDRLETVKPLSVYFGYRFGLKFLYEVERLPCRQYESPQ